MGQEFPWMFPLREDPLDMFLKNNWWYIYLDSKQRVLKILGTEYKDIVLYLKESKLSPWLTQIRFSKWIGLDRTSDSLFAKY